MARENQDQYCPQSNGETVEIVADDRERGSVVVESLLSTAGVSVRSERLQLGDYRVDRKLLFETLQDFAQSIVDGRLFKQTVRLANSSYRAVLILEGTGKDADGLGVRREALQGALITISLILGLPVLRSMKAEETAKLIVYAARQFASFAKPGRYRPGYRPGNKKRRQLYILQGLPGVGHERARRLLDKFGSVEDVMGASCEDLQTVEGIGAKTADRIRWAISEKITPYGDGDDLVI
jgi:DNA excision repair protein ERCC-4